MHLLLIKMVQVIATAPGLGFSIAHVKGFVLCFCTLGNAWLRGFGANNLLVLNPRMISTAAETLERQMHVPVAMLAASLKVGDGVLSLAGEAGTSPPPMMLM
jgi:hypothetical protein